MTALPLRDFTPYERDCLDVIEAAPAAPESFDATAALRRVLALADELDNVPRGELMPVTYAAVEIRRAVRGD